MSATGILASAWLTAVPYNFFNTKFTPSEFQTSVQLRLGNVVGTTLCTQCGEPNDSDGNHQLTCLKAGHFVYRHNLIRDSLAHIGTSAHIQTRTEGTGYIAGTQRRPGDVIFTDFLANGTLLCDVAVINPMCDNWINLAIRGRGVAVAAKDEEKRNEYRPDLIEVQPVCFEALGCPSSGAIYIINALANRLANYTADYMLDDLNISAQTLYVHQRVSVALQKGNALMINHCGKRMPLQDDQLGIANFGPVVDMTFVEPQEVLRGR